MTQKYTCPCCGYKTLNSAPPGSYEICPICYWEDDDIQFEYPEYTGGANNVSLKQAQHNFLEIGVSEKRLLKFVRKPNNNDEKDPKWKPLK